MIQRRTMLKPADNTGAHALRVIHIYGGGTRKLARLGDIVRAVVVDADPNGMPGLSSIAGKILTPLGPVFSDQWPGN